MLRRPTHRPVPWRRGSGPTAGGSWNRPQWEGEGRGQPERTGLWTAVGRPGRHRRANLTPQGRGRARDAVTRLKSSKASLNKPPENRRQDTGKRATGRPTLAANRQRVVAGRLGRGTDLGQVRHGPSCQKGSWAPKWPPFTALATARQPPVSARSGASPACGRRRIRNSCVAGAPRLHTNMDTKTNHYHSLTSTSWSIVHSCNAP